MRFLIAILIAASLEGVTADNAKEFFQSVYNPQVHYDGDGNVIGHGPGGHQDPRLAVPDDMEDSDERTAGPLQDRDDLPFRALSALFLGDDDTDLVLVKGSPAFPGTDEYRIGNTVDADEEVPFPVHPGHTLDFDPRMLLFRLFSQFAALSAAGFLSGHIVYRISTLGLT